MSHSVLVTGGGRGIGRSIAVRFANQDCAVAVMARSGDQLEQLVAELRDQGKRVLAVIGDVRNEGDCEAAVRKTEESFGSVDVLVNNAGIFRTAPLVETPTELWQSVLETNLSGVFYTTRAFARCCLQHGNGGFVINISSVAGKQGFPGSGAYCASKFGLFGFSEAIREELRPLGVRVITVCPGQTDTAAWDTSGLDLKALGIDRKMMMQPGDVAAAVVHAVMHQGSAVLEEIVLKPIAGE